MQYVIFVTTKDRDEAEKISFNLVENKLVACANIIEGIKSIFCWEGNIDNVNETLIIMKTKKELFKKVAEAVKSLHSYTVPEIIAFNIADGNKEYLDWIDQNVLETKKNK